ncbi:hypothetical protein [Streptomyces sp. AD55]|uniref:hypothetical protein n=1 Tax=Streptomyces sp. AD55 TaxID=3242895 RepID=UPI003526F2C7
MTTAVPTDRERGAVQAYLRLLSTVRAGLDAPGGPAAVPPGVLDEAESALRAAGLSGTEESFFRLLRSWYPPTDGPAAPRA